MSRRATHQERRNATPVLSRPKGARATADARPSESQKRKPQDSSCSVDTPSEAPSGSQERWRRKDALAGQTSLLRILTQRAQREEG